MSPENQQREVRSVSLLMRTGEGDRSGVLLLVRLALLLLGKLCSVTEVRLLSSDSNLALGLVLLSLGDVGLR